MSSIDPRHDPRAFFHRPELMQLPWVESPFFEQLLQSSGLDDEQKELARRFSRDGLLTLDLEIDDFEDRARRIQEDLGPRYPVGNRRIHEAWMFNDDVRALATHSKVLSVLQMLYGREPIPFQTLNFEVGTQQLGHSDVVHFYSRPRRFMCGVWIALEDIDDQNGALFYYPGSHRLPEYDFDDLGLKPDIEEYPVYESFVRVLTVAEGLEPKELHLKPGSAVIWAANLLHGGSPVKDPSRTRQSQVTHYFFEGGAWYMPLGSDPFGGDVCFREVIDLKTGHFVPQTIRGQSIDLATRKNVWRYPRPLPDWVRD
ncbi:MAG: phytanoyl-CoA dioxygenase family protein [Planctomycetota bacterium]